MSSKEIAIIGMAARIPGCKNIRHFWENILSGKELISNFSPTDKLSETSEKYIRALWEHKSYIKSTYILDNIDKFDAEFFGFSPSEAQLTDPQFRVCLETAWEALENSGYCADKYDGNIGTFMASNTSDYLLKHLYQLVHDEMISGNEFPLVYQSNMDYMSTNIAFRLNLNGPSMNIQNWCTSGLASIHMACKSLQVNDCDMALAGGVHLKLPQRGYFSQGSVSDSAEGKCRSFDEKASGTVPSNGVAVFVLKRLDRSIAENDSIYAVIKGSAINNDGAGKNKLSYHSPSIKGQDNVVKKALADAGVEASTVQYVEAHGGATEFGDRSELAALAKNYGKSDSEKTILGCVKPNVGHMGNISGIPGLLKAILALQHKMIPPTINFNKMNMRNARICRNLSISKECIDFERIDGIPLRAAVHNYAVGGSNAHIILEEAPEVDINRKYNHQSILLILSAKSRAQLDTIKKNITDHYNENYDSEITDIVYTLNTGRREFDHRYFCVLDTRSPTSTFNARIVCESVEKASLNESRNIILYLGSANQHFFEVCNNLVNRYNSFRTDFENSIHLIELVTGVNDFSLKSVYHRSIEKNDTVSAGLLYIAYSLSLIELLGRLGIEYTSLAAAGNGEFVALHKCGILSFKEMIRFFVRANEESKMRISENFAALFLEEKRDDFIGYFSTEQKKYVTVNEIRKTEYWKNIIQTSADDISMKMSTDECDIIDLARLSFYTKKEALNRTQTVDSKFAMDTLLGKMWLKGVKIDWDEYFDNTRLKKISLPTYPFIRKRYWISSPILNSSTKEKSLNLSAGESTAEIQNNIISLWQKIIGTEEVLPNDNFYTLGGNSFIGMVFLTKLYTVYKQLDISFKDIDEHPTVEKLASFIYKQLNTKNIQRTSEPDSANLKIRIGEKGYLDKYLRNIITRLNDGQEDVKNLELGGMIKDLCFYLRRDLNMVVFTHEIEKYKTIEELIHFIEENLWEKREESKEKAIVRNSFNWLPEMIVHDKKNKNRRAIFILSTPRSGSTLLRVMLNRHSGLFAPPELGLLIYNTLPEWYEKYWVSEVSRDGLVYAFMNALGLTFNEARSYIISLVSKKISILETYALLQENIGNKLLVDKTPYYGYKKEIIEKAKEMFENPFYIFLHKHPYSMIESFARNRFDKLVDHRESNAYLMAENEWSTINQNIMKFLKDVDDEKYVKISFEQLVGDPGKTMKKVFQKMKVPFENAVLNPYDKNTMLVGPGDFNILSHDSIDHSLGEKWKTVRLPNKLQETTIALANELEYTLPD